MAGTRAEFEHRLEDARALYQQAWELHTDDYDAYIAAHYVARFQDSATESLRWNRTALEHANAVKDEQLLGRPAGCLLRAAPEIQFLPGSSRTGQRVSRHGEGPVSSAH